MRPIVLDTGVLVKVFVADTDSSKATTLFRAAAEGTYRLAAPDFMAVEFGHVLWKYVGRGTLHEKEARQTLLDFPYDRFEWLPARALLEKAFGFARAYDIAVHDGAFLAAAVDLDVELVTADAALHRKVSNRLPWVKLLREFQP